MSKPITLFQATLTRLINHRYFLPVCLITAFLIRVGWIYAIDAQPISDARWYYERGLDLAQGLGYSVTPDSYWPHNLVPADLTPADNYIPDDRRPTAYWPVGYPAFLGLLFFLVGPSLLAAKLANVLLYLGVLLLSYTIAKRLFQSEITGRMTLLILVFYPEHIAYTSLLGTEILFLFLLLGGITLLLIPSNRIWVTLAAGVVFGLTCLVKPQAFFVPVVFLSLRKKSFQSQLMTLIIVYMALGLTILPWLIRNYQTFNSFVFISNNGGYNLLVGNHHRSNGAYVFHDQLVDMLSGVQGETARNQKAFELAVAYMVDQPVDTLKLWPDKLWHLYRRDASGAVWNERSLNPSTEAAATFFYGFAKLSQLYYMLIGAALALSLPVIMIEHRKSGCPFPLLGLGLVGYFTLVYLITFGDSRFHFPMMPWLVMYAGGLVAVLLRPGYSPVGDPVKKTKEFECI